MRALVIVDRNWGIGCDGSLQFDLPKELKYFKETTMGKAIVMGRRTFESLPGKRPLPGRDNIILTRDPDFEVPGALVLRSLEALNEHLKGYAPENVMLIGGEGLFNQLLDRCYEALVTHVDATAPADRHFPNLQEHPDWRLKTRGEPLKDNGYTYRICVYERV